MIVSGRKSTLALGLLAGFIGAGFTGLVTPTSLTAQSQLEQVESLTRMGRTEEARLALMDWWESDRPDASRRERQRGLWLRGRLTVDPVQAELDFRRLTVLYPSGQFTPDAMLRLAQASWAMGNEQESRDYVASLVRDYPRSDARERAEEWLMAAGPLPPAGDTPTRSAPNAAGLPEGMGGAAAPERTRPGADERRPPPVTAERRLPPPAESTQAGRGSRDVESPAMNYYVQLGAFGEADRALSLYEEVTEQGVEARVVRVAGSRFTHVRVGRFANRAAAVEVLEALTAEGINAALVRDDRPEEVIRG